MLPSFGNSRGQKGHATEQNPVYCTYSGMYFGYLGWSFKKNPESAVHVTNLQSQNVYAYFMQIFNPLLNKT